MSIHDDDTAAEVAEEVTRRSGALMWMGALLGGAIIGSLFLGFNYWSTYQENKQLSAKYEKASTELTEAKNKLTLASLREKEFESIVKDLHTKNTELSVRRGVKPAPLPVLRNPNPFADPPVQ